MKQFRRGTQLRLEQAPELATHLVYDADYSEKTLCGQQRAKYASYDVAVVVNRNGLEYYDGFPALHHVDCKRCNSLYLKYTS